MSKTDKIDPPQMFTDVPGARRDQSLLMRLTAAEKKVLKDLARQAGLRTQSFLRSLIRSAAERV